MIDATNFLPVIGYPIAQKQMVDDLESGKISFQEACYISVVNSTIYAGTMIAAAQTNYLAAMQFQRVAESVITAGKVSKIAAPAAALITAGTVINEQTRKRIGSKHYTTPFTSGFGPVV